MKRISISILAALVLLAAGAIGGSLVGANGSAPVPGRVYSELVTLTNNGNWVDVMTVPAWGEFVVQDLWPVDVQNGVADFGFRRGGVETQFAATNAKQTWEGGFVLQSGDTLLVRGTSGETFGICGYLQ